MAVVIGRCRLRQLLKERDMTQSELAKLTGRSRQKISNYANDIRVMSYETAIDIAYALGCYAEELYELQVDDDRQKK